MPLRPVPASFTSFAHKSELEVDFYVVSTPFPSSTSLACKSEPKVDIYCVSTPFSLPPPPLPAKASRRWIFLPLRRHFHLRSALFPPPPLGLYARPSRRWTFMAFRRRLCL